MLAAAVLLTLVAAWTLTTVSFDNSTERLLVRDSPAWRVTSSVRRTFGGDELIRRAYEEAIAREYRFYSYGDAMLIL